MPQREAESSEKQNWFRVENNWFGPDRHEVREAHPHTSYCGATIPNSQMRHVLSDLPAFVHTDPSTSLV